MKKLLLIICFSLLSFNYANSEIKFSAGVSGNIASLDATGEENITGVTDQQYVWGALDTSAPAAGAGTATTKTTKESDEMFMGYVSLFGEIHMPTETSMGDLPEVLGGFRLGISYVPYTMETETNENNRAAKCDQSASCTQFTNKVLINIEDMASAYLAYHLDLEDMLIDSIFVKGGIMQANIITKETLGSGSSYGNTTLNGEFYGAGIEKNVGELFIRSEVSYTTFDKVKLTSIGSDNTNTIELSSLEGANAVISVGKTF